MHSPAAAHFPADVAAAAALNHHQQVQHIVVTTSAHDAPPAGAYVHHQQPQQQVAAPPPPLPQYTGIAHQPLHPQPTQPPEAAVIAAAPGAYPFHARRPERGGFGGFRGGRGGGLNTWEAAKVFNSMSQYNSNPVGALQERFQSRGIMPNYRMVQADGASHCPTFAYQVLVQGYIAQGFGSSKKQAKHAAARNMLDKLDGRIPAQDGLTPMPPVNHLNASVASDNGTANLTTSSEGGESSAAGGGGGDASSVAGASSVSGGGPTMVMSSSNTVGQLQEMCVRRGLPMPMYDLEKMEGQPHQRSFSMTVRVGQLAAEGHGTSKKDAKRDAALRMVKMLNVMKEEDGGAAKARQNGGGASEEEGEAGGRNGTEQDGAGDEEVDELARKMGSGLSFKPLTTEKSEQIQEFWHRNLTGAEGSQLQRLHAAPLSRSGDHVGALRRLSEEQSFVVTYVSVGEDCLEGDGDGGGGRRHNCLVQLATFPVAVCMGTGADADAAKVDAARNALVYIRTMTKDSKAGGKDRGQDKSNGGGAVNGN